MSPSAEQLCGITRSKKHRGVKWSDREHQSNFLSKIIHFFKKFQSFRLIMLFFFLIFYLLLQVVQLYVLRTMSLHSWLMDWFLHAAVFTFQRLLLEAASQFQTQAGYCKAKWFSCFCVLCPSWELRGFFLGRTLLWLKISAMSPYDLSPWFWSLQTSAPVKQTIQIAWLLLISCPFPFPFLFVLSVVAKKPCKHDRASKSGDKAKETLLHNIFIISRFILWQLHVTSTSSFTRSWYYKWIQVLKYKTALCAWKKPIKTS